MARPKVKTTRIDLKVKPEVKKRAKEVAVTLGLSLTDFITEAIADKIEAHEWEGNTHGRKTDI